MDKVDVTLLKLRAEEKAEQEEHDKRKELWLELASIAGQIRNTYDETNY